MLINNLENDRTLQYHFSRHYFPSFLLSPEVPRNAIIAT